ncbi:hypothetical protein [Microbacterium pumilum]|uniref:hypothetical protein n=1 Tax=Microbacterium pumilum TaxID=344165 RepID=UPI0031D8FDC4
MVLDESEHCLHIAHLLDDLRPIAAASVLVEQLPDKRRLPSHTCHAARIDVRDHV